MKLARFVFAVVVCALTGSPAFTARAFDVPTFDFGNNVPLPAEVVQLYTDLNSIPVGTSPTDAQHQALVADLNALAAGVFTPDPAVIDQLATDLGTAATAGLFSDDVLEDLADDFISDSDDPTDYADGWLDDVQNDVAYLIVSSDPTADPSTGTGSGLTYSPGTTIDPLVGTIYQLGATTPADMASTRVSVRLAAQGIPPGLLENYSGLVQLDTQTTNGGATVDTIRLTTSGLPPINSYTVSITRQSDGGSVTVGKLRVRVGVGGPTTSLFAPSNFCPEAEFLTYGDAVFGGGNPKKPLPAGFAASDVATVTVADSQGVVRLLGTVAGAIPASQMQALSLRLNGTGTMSARVPYANVAIRHEATDAKTTDRLRFMARHLPSNASVTLSANGVAIGQYTTTVHGRLFIVEGFDPSRLNRHGVTPAFDVLPPGTNLSGAKSFTLSDAQGTVLLSGTLD